MSTQKKHLQNQLMIRFRYFSNDTKLTTINKSVYYVDNMTSDEYSKSCQQWF